MADLISILVAAYQLAVPCLLSAHLPASSLSTIIFPIFFTLSYILPFTPFLHPVRYATKFRHEADILPLRYREDARSSKARGYNLTRISYQSFQFLHLPVRPIKAGGSVHKSRAVHFLTGSETCLRRLTILVTFAFNSRPLSPADTVVPVGAMLHKHTHT